MSDNNADGSSANKRKREDESVDTDSQRLSSHNGSNGNIPGLTGSNDSQSYHAQLGHYDTHSMTSDINIDQQLLTHVAPSNGLPDDNTLTAKAALAAHPQNKYPPPPDGGFDGTGQLGHGLTFGDEMNQAASSLSGHGPNSTAAAVYAAREAQSMSSKPTVGTAEWHALRKNNHKEGILDTLSSFSRPILINISGTSSS
jgi:hypothetical protein